MARLGRLIVRIPEPVWAVAIFVVTTAAAMAWRWIIAPVTTDPSSVEPADAVVLFIGGTGERLEKALELMDRGVAETLVISAPTPGTWPDADRLCRGTDAPFEVVCPQPDPRTTRGEARIFGELAADRGWDRLVMVTSTYHVGRARLLLERCFDGDVTAVDATPDLSAWGWAQRMNHEWFGHLHARVVARDC